MQVEVLEAVYEAAQRQLFTAAFVQRKSGEFNVNGEWIWFVRRNANEVTIKVQGVEMDVIAED